MRSRIFHSLLIVCALASLVGTLTQCEKMGTSLLSEDSAPPLPQERYDHDVHKETIEKNGYDCSFCHPFKVNPEDQTAALNLDRDKLFVKSLNQLCHPCHQLEARQIPERYACYTCHDKSEGVVPPNHNSGWLRRHALVKQNTAECRHCHLDSYCIDCHRRFERIQPRVHSRNYRYFHGLEARLDPGSCYSCHRNTQCVDCHIREGAVIR